MGVFNTKFQGNTKIFGMDSVPVLWIMVGSCIGGVSPGGWRITLFRKTDANDRNIPGPDRWKRFTKRCNVRVLDRKKNGLDCRVENSF